MITPDRVSRRRQILYQLRTWHVRWVTRLLRPTARPIKRVSDRPAIVFAPHQDDETLGCGGLIALKRSLGVTVRVIFLTDGDIHGDTIRIRREEALNALSRLGVAATEVDFWDYPDGGLSDLSPMQQVNLREQIMGVLAIVPGAEIYVPHAIDQHCDHEATYQLVTAAITQTSASYLVYQYPIWIFWKAPLFLKLKPHHLQGWQLLNINDVIVQKQAAIAAHASQVSTFPTGFIKQFQRPEEWFYIDKP
jgi:N-acetylglucosamine malate deacetylase 1